MSSAAARTDGVKMDEEDKNNIRLHFNNLLNNLKMDELWPYATKLDLFTDEMRNKIKREGSNPHQAAKMLMLLPTCGSGAFDKFYECLIHSNHEDIAKLLRPNIDIDEYRRERGLAKDPEIETVEQTSDLAADNDMPGLHRAVPAVVCHTESTTDPSMSADTLVNSSDHDHETSTSIDTLIMYSMENIPRGKVLIISNGKFHDNTGLAERSSTEHDAANLERLLERLHYAVTVRANLTAERMKQSLIEFRNHPDHEQLESAVVAILTYGKTGAVIGVDGFEVQLNYISQLFAPAACKALRSKPKIFIIQACPQQMVRKSLSESRADCEDEVVREFMDVKALKDRIPLIPDICYSISTLPACISCQSAERSCWFIQALMETLGEQGESKEIQHVLTAVNEQISHKFHQSYTSHIEISCVKNMFTKKFYFNSRATADNNASCDNSADEDNREIIL